MSSIPDALRDFVRQRANGRCEYCLVREEDFLLPHEADHIVATQHRGQTVAENLALACIRCNRRKGPNLTSVDTETGVVTGLFNPRRDQWSDHFRCDGPLIVGLTPGGRATILALQLNSEERLRVRRALLREGRFP